MKKYYIKEVDSTYCNGYWYIITKDIIKADIIKLCNIMNNKLGQLNNCTYEPEPITEGGIVCRFNYNDRINPKKDEHYKTIRINWNNHIYNKKSSRYWIDNTVIDDWKDSNDIVMGENSIIPTFLKSFNGALLYTQEELDTLNECFAEIGMIKKGKRKIGKNRLKTVFKNKVYLNTCSCGRIIDEDEVSCERFPACNNRLFYS